MIYLVILIIIIISASSAYQRAKKTGRKPVLWAFIAVIAFLGTQGLLSFSLGIIFIIAMKNWDWNEKVSAIFEIINPTAFLATYIVTNWLILRHLDKTTSNSFNEPPPPPTFE
ncbi:MAG: hypothetical protein M3033_19260 [Acidobacteriota bacterium]|nr:hypothetical protein [Acidobacteriota bacterium]